VLDEIWTRLVAELQMVVPPAFPIVVPANAALAESTIASSAIADAMTPWCLSRRNPPTLLDRMSSTSGRP
jgi:hypothetical protein